MNIRAKCEPLGSIVVTLILATPAISVELF